MNPQELRKQVKALEDSVQSMDSWIQVKKSVLDAYSWKIDDLRSQLRKRKWSRGSAPALKEELHLAQVRYSNLEKSVLAGQAALDEQKRILNEYYRNKTFTPERSHDQVTESPTRQSGGLQSQVDFNQTSSAATEAFETGFALDGTPEADLFDPTDSEIFFREIDTELQSLGVSLNVTEEYPQLPPVSKPAIPAIAELAPSSDSEIPVTEIVIPETPIPDPLHLEVDQADWPPMDSSSDLRLPDARLAHLSGFSARLEESVADFGAFQSHEGFSVRFDNFERWAGSPSPNLGFSLNLAELVSRQIQKVQQKIPKLEAEIQQMSSWIAQQQEELASYDWTIQNLRDRMNIDSPSPSSIPSIRQELNYVLEQSQSLNQSIQFQRQKCAKSQQQLDHFYKAVARLQQIPALEAAIAKLSSWIEQQQEELDALNWTIQDLRDRLKRDERDPRTTLGIHQELDYALDQYAALEHSVYLQQQKLAEQQALLQASYAELNGSQPLS